MQFYDENKKYVTLCIITPELGREGMDEDCFVTLNVGSDNLLQTYEKTTSEMKKQTDRCIKTSAYEDVTDNSMTVQLTWLIFLSQCPATTASSLKTRTNSICTD